MKIHSHPSTLSLAILLFCIHGLAAQDFHYAQAVASPLNVNPGLTGGFDGNERFALNFRRQWSSIPVTFMQVSGAFDHRFTDNRGRFLPWSGGVVFNYDRTGDAQLSFMQLGLSGAYSFRILPQKAAVLTLAAAASGIQRSFSTTHLRWDDQYTLKDGYAENIATGERFQSGSRLLGDVSAGFNLHLPHSKERTSLDIGVGGFHLNQPRKDFADETPAKLNTRLSVRLAGLMQLSRRFDLAFSMDGQFQSAFRQALVGASALYHVSQQKTEELTLQLGAYYRSGDAIIPMAALRFSAWQVFLSYDINLSTLTNATLYRGGPEVSVVYIVRQVPKVPFCKTCPIQM